MTRKQIEERTHLVFLALKGEELSMNDKRIIIEGIHSAISLAMGLPLMKWVNLS